CCASRASSRLTHLHERPSRVALLEGSAARAAPYLSASLPARPNANFDSASSWAEVDAGRLRSHRDVERGLWRERGRTDVGRLGEVADRSVELGLEAAKGSLQPAVEVVPAAWDL